MSSSSEENEDATIADLISQITVCTCSRWSNRLLFAALAQKHPTQRLSRSDINAIAETDPVFVTPPRPKGRQELTAPGSTIPGPAGMFSVSPDGKNAHGEPALALPDAAGSLDVSIWDEESNNPISIVSILSSSSTKITTKKTNKMIV